MQRSILISVILSAIYISGKICLNTSLYEVYSVSWSGDRIRQFDIRFVDQARSMLACASLATKYLLTDQILVFIGGSGVPQQECFLAKRMSGLCLLYDLHVRQTPYCKLATASNTDGLRGCCTRTFVISPNNCSGITMQHRVDNTTNFYRNWTQYAVGFGSGPQLNFWIGLRTLSYLTWPNPKCLRVRTKDWNDTEYVADFANFSVARETDLFKLGTLNYISGDTKLRNAVLYHSGMNFSTFDSDNDNNTEGNCALGFKGAWWFKNCHMMNPNGIYYYPPRAFNTSPEYGHGLDFVTLSGVYYSMKEYEMIVY